MTRAQTKALMPVLVAWGEGREVQNRYRNHTEWSTEMIPDPNFEAEGFEWRVKPTPREFWVVVDKYGTIHGASSCSAGTNVYAGCDIIHVREVVE